MPVLPRERLFKPAFHKAGVADDRKLDRAVGDRFFTTFGDKRPRNALSHGSVSYLDDRGRQSEDATNMLGFAAYPSFNRRDELRVLRIAVDGYQRFVLFLRVIKMYGRQNIIVFELLATAR